MSGDQRRTYYNNCASRLLNSYNPNILYPEFPNQWNDERWFSVIDTVASFGFGALEFWLEPRLHHLFEIIQVRGYHSEMTELAALLRDDGLREPESFTIAPDVETYRNELLFSAELFAATDRLFRRSIDWDGSV